MNIVKLSDTIHIEEYRIIGTNFVYYSHLSQMNPFASGRIITEQFPTIIQMTEHVGERLQHESLISGLRKSHLA